MSDLYVLIYSPKFIRDQKHILKISDSLDLIALKIHDLELSLPS